jgi:hypothetical protein
MAISTAWALDYGGSYLPRQDKESGANQKKIDGLTHQGTEHGLELENIADDLCVVFDDESELIPSTCTCMKFPRFQDLGFDVSNSSLDCVTFLVTFFLHFPHGLGSP